MEVEALLEVVILLENFCGMVIKNDRITQFKFHLSHTDLHSNSKKCPNVPLEVTKEMRTFG